MIQPRYYQADAKTADLKSFETNRSALVVKATGLGKSVLFSEVANEFVPQGKVLCLGHRLELVNQNAAHLLRSTGEQVDIEQAENWASMRARVVSPGANIPYAGGAVEMLHRREIVAIPDFISNSGGVHLYESVEQDDEPEVALAKIEQLVGGAVLRTLATADSEGITPLAAALREVRAFLAAETGAAEDVLDELVAA